MSSKLSFLTSGATWLIIATWVIIIGNAIVPVVPANIANIIGTITTIIGLIIHSNQIKAGRVASGI